MMYQIRRVQNRSSILEKEINDEATNTKVTVGNTSTSVLAANANRIEFVVVNDSNEVIYIALGATATINSGIRLNSNGGSYLNNSYTGAISAICSSGGKNLTVCEY